MFHKRPEKDTENPPGQIITPIPDAITERNIREWKKWEDQRKAKEIVNKYKDILSRLKDR